MSELSKIFFIPLLIVLISLIIEYWVIQPLRQKKIRLPFWDAQYRTWARAIDLAIKKFRRQRIDLDQHSRREGIRIEETTIHKGRATIKLAVTVTNPLRVIRLGKFAQEPLVIERFEIIVDRSGDILDIKSVEVAAEFRIISNIKSSIQDGKHGGKEAVFEFTVSNNGKMGDCCFAVEIDVVKIRSLDGKYAPEKVRMNFKHIEIDAFSVKPITLVSKFNPPELPLINSAHKIKIEVLRCAN